MGEDELARLEAMRAGINLWEFEGSYIEVGPDESEYISAMSEAMPRLIAEVRRLRDERDALTNVIGGGLISGLCPCCHPELGRDMFTEHDEDCPFRNWRRDGLDATITALVPVWKEIAAQTATALARWEAEHPERAAELRKRATHP